MYFHLFMIVLAFRLITLFSILLAVSDMKCVHRLLKDSTVLPVQQLSILRLTSESFGAVLSMLWQLVFLNNIGIRISDTTSARVLVISVSCKIRIKQLTDKQTKARCCYARNSRERKYVQMNVVFECLKPTTGKTVLSSVMVVSLKSEWGSTTVMTGLLTSQCPLRQKWL